MGQNTGIEWATHTFNPWRGCTRVSEACRNCYAETWSKKNPLVLGVWGPNGTRVVAAPAQWREARKWNRIAGENEQRHAAACLGSRSEYDLIELYERPRVFMASLADVFEDWAGPMHAADGKPLRKCQGCDWEGTTDVCPDCAGELRPVTMEWVRLRALILAHNCRNLDWLLLTKRPENILRMTAGLFDPWPAHVWIGTTVENQGQADRRIPELLKVPAAVRFLSCEPLLGPVDLGRSCCIGRVRALDDVGLSARLASDVEATFSILDGLNWVIVGGESGPDARPMHPDWARSLRDQCQAAGVPFFFKQWGEWIHPHPKELHLSPAPLTEWEGLTIQRVGKKAAGRLLDGRTWDEFPEVRA